MEPVFSIEYYRENKNKFEGNKKALNLKEELKQRMSIFDMNCFCSNELKVIERTQAKYIYDRAKKKLLKEKELYEKVKKNSSVLGHINKAQEIKEAHNVITMFEYNCFVLREFKNEYNL